MAPHECRPRVIFVCFFPSDRHHGSTHSSTTLLSVSSYNSWRNTGLIATYLTPSALPGPTCNTNVGRQVFLQDAQTVLLYVRETCFDDWSALLSSF